MLSGNYQKSHMFLTLYKMGQSLDLSLRGMTVRTALLLLRVSPGILQCDRKGYKHEWSVGPDADVTTTVLCDIRQVSFHGGGLEDLQRTFKAPKLYYLCLSFHSIRDKKLDPTLVKLEVQVFRNVLSTCSYYLFIMIRIHLFIHSFIP